MIKRKRYRSVAFRLTEEEWQTVDERSRIMGISKSRYMRNLALGIVPRPLPSGELLEILRQLRHIGNNINQLSMAANRTGSLDTVLYKDNYALLQRQISKLMDMMLQPSFIQEDICR